MEFLIGQCVIYSHREIVHTIPEPKHAGASKNDRQYQWVRRANGIENYVAISNLKPLPNGQL